MSNHFRAAGTKIVWRILDAAVLEILPIPLLLLYTVYFVLLFGN